MHTKDTNITQTLVEQARRGNQQAMHKLYKMYVHAMYNISIRIVSNQQDAEDILQESFTTAFNGLSSLKENTLFGSWLKRIVANRSIDHLRKQKRLFADVDELQLADENITDNDIADDITPEMIHEAIKMLPDKARVVFNLYLLEGYMHKEIAEVLEISESTSKSQYRRACKLLQEELKEMVNSKNIS